MGVHPEGESTNTTQLYVNFLQTSLSETLMAHWPVMLGSVGPAGILEKEDTYRPLAQLHTLRRNSWSQMPPKLLSYLCLDSLNEKEHTLSRRNLPPFGELPGLHVGFYNISLPVGVGLRCSCFGLWFLASVVTDTEQISPLGLGNTLELCLRRN